MVKGMHARKIEVVEPVDPMCPIHGWISTPYESCVCDMRVADCRPCRIEDWGGMVPRSITRHSMVHTWEPGCWKYEKLNFMVGVYLEGMS